MTEHVRESDLPGCVELSAEFIAWGLRYASPDPKLEAKPVKQKKASKPFTYKPPSKPKKAKK
jgi:hypothetical protein